MPKSHLTREGIIVCYIRYSWEDDDADQGEYLDITDTFPKRITDFEIGYALDYVLHNGGKTRRLLLAKTAVKHNCCVCFLLCSRERCNNFFHVNCLSHFWSRTFL